MNKISKIVSDVKAGIKVAKTAFNPITKERDMRRDAIEEGCHNSNLLENEQSGD